jgi:hypothetical protein
LVGGGIFQRQWIMASAELMVTVSTSEARHDTAPDEAALYDHEAS